MQLSVTGHHIEVTDSLRWYVEKKLERITRHFDHVLDVRRRDEWDSGHLDGALHIPLDSLTARLKELPKDKLIAAYCT